METQLDEKSQGWLGDLANELVKEIQLSKSKKSKSKNPIVINDPVKNLSFMREQEKKRVINYYKTKLFTKSAKKKRRRSPLPLQLYCRICKTTNTPEWRRGPDGYKSLCNACGLRYSADLKKEKSIKLKRPAPIPINSILNSSNTNVQNNGKSINNQNNFMDYYYCYSNN